MNTSHIFNLVKDSIRNHPDLTIRVPGDLRLVKPSALPAWWSRGNNIALSSVEIDKLPVTAHAGQESPTNSILVIGANCVTGGMVMWGEGSVVLLGDHVRLPASSIACGSGAKVMIGAHTASTARAQINARNGGSVLVGERGLWAADVVLYTDDMHAIRDVETGRRLNGMGGHMVVSDHVWLGYQSLLLGNVGIGRDSVVGARSLVRGTIPPNSVAAGSPARVVRTGVTWDFNDLP
ncbi:acyltransferase [Enterovirga rhinocerotis]|nr:hypothetical protein [Enterovirga rhinocerotis]